MANTNNPKGFNVIDAHLYQPDKIKLDASYAGKEGDFVFRESAGYGSDTASGVILGIQVSAIENVVTKVVETTGGTAGTSQIDVITDPNVRFTGQISTFALTDPYTTRSGADCYDVAGSAGAEYIDAAASINDMVKVVKLSHEYDTGTLSEVGAYAKCVFAFNQLKHELGVIA